MFNSTIAVDLAKNVFEIAVSRKPGKVHERLRLSRSRFRTFFVERQPALFVMEACGSAHYWGRAIQAAGHDVVLLPPHSVRPYVQRNKTDRADAKGILEAFRNVDICQVPLRTVNQQVLSSLHRARSAWQHTRTARINMVRGLLREFGITIPVGARRVVALVGELLEDPDSQLPEALRPVLFESCQEIVKLEARMRQVEKQLAALAKQAPDVALLRTIPGIGLLTATALVALIGDVRRFRSARHLASYLGLVPKERSSGNKRRLGRISKRGDAYIRMLLTHGARSVILAAKKHGARDHLRQWALRLEERRGHNKAAIAVANKLARTIWAVWKKRVEFEPRPAAAA